MGAVRGDAGRGAATGALVGGIRARRAEKKEEKQAEAQQQQKSRTNFENAFAACMEGKGYTVK